MLTRASLRSLNHVLEQQQWARLRLAPYAGQTIFFRLPPLPDLQLALTAEGLAVETGREALPDLVVDIKPSAIPFLLLRDEAAMREIEITGSAELAQVVQHLFREIEWDFEEDLSRIVGDIAAHRMAEAARELFVWQRDAGLRLAHNFAEYWTEENPLVARRDDVGRFTRSVDELRDDAERLEKRLERLQQRLPV